LSASADDFITILRESLSPLVHAERTVYADFKSSRGFTTRPGQSSVTVQFYNLPESRVRQRRGGGAEAENNRAMFWIHGFDEDSATPVAKVKVEHSVNSIGRPDHWAPKRKGKSGSPDKIATYVAEYINEIAEQFEPNLTHE
jgi:hypothetical protein